MESSVTTKELQDFFDQLGLDTHDQVELLTPYLETGYGDSHEQGESAGTLGHLVVEVEEGGGVRSARSTKLRHVVLNIPKAIRDPQAWEHLLEAALAGIEAAENLEHELKMGLAILLFLGRLRHLGHLASVELANAEARLLHEMVLLELEEGTIRKADLEQHMQPWMSSERLYEALIKLETLGCVILTLDEVIFHETIEIRKSEPMRRHAEKK